MKALLNRRTIVITAVAVLIAITAIISANLFNSNGPVTGLANAVSRPIRGLASQIARAFESIYASVYRYDLLVAQYDEILKENAELKRDYSESAKIAAENERLRALVGFRERHTGYEHKDADIFDWSSSNWSSSFTIDIGYANSSIQRGNGVVTEYGVLVGQVSNVGATTSTVISVLDTTFSAGALIGVGNGIATMSGDFALMRSGLLMLDKFDDDLIVLSGDTVFTSGSGGVFPEGLIVGEVVEVLKHPTGVGRYATVRPMREIETLLHVFVITDFEIASGALISEDEDFG